MSAPEAPSPESLPTPPSPPSTSPEPGSSQPAMWTPKKRESIWRVSDGDVPWPIVDDVVIDDGAPVDNIFSERQMRLLTRPLYSSWSGPKPGIPFIEFANVGLFCVYGQPPIVPDVMLSLDISQPQDLTIKENLSYFLWRRGKVPDVAIEIVSNREGEEDGGKLEYYARHHIPYYVIFDPDDLLGRGMVRAYIHSGRQTYQPTTYDWWEDVGLGLKLWNGNFEGMTATWLRWCDKHGIVIPTGEERVSKAEEEAKHAQERADKAEARAGRLADRLRALGMDPAENGS
jgi:hypothetical protein